MNPIYQQLFNAQCFTPDYYQQQHVMEQNQEIIKGMNALRDLCRVIKKITPDYYQTAIAAFMSVVWEESNKV